MESINNFIGAINGFAWGPPMLVLLGGTGLLLSIATKFVQYRKLGTAFKLLGEKGDPEHGDISPRQSLMTALSATIGTGNIAGVATAIAAGGPGAVFWMWITAIVGGATKFSEAVLAIKYRIKNDKGERSGGPMYYCSKGFEDKYGWKGFGKVLGWIFALFGTVAAFGIGNMVQSNSVADGLNSSFGINKYVTGVVIMILLFLVIIGGIKSIGKVADIIVPFMAFIYVVTSLVIIFANADKIGYAFNLVFKYAFNATAVKGGLLGAVIRYGVARGVFSNEAGLGSAPIAHAASTNNDPVKQGIIASLGCFIDTIIVCTMTALVILMSGFVAIGGDGFFAVKDGLTSAALTSTAYESLMPGFGGYVVALGLVFFAFSTMVGWYYYGSKCFEYIAGTKLRKIYAIVFVLLVFVGAATKLSFVWNLSDTFNGLMALPNLIALVLLSPVILLALKEYDKGPKL